ncbi:MAG: alpha/beta fold hydrolase, partial [Bacteroidota bacterium]
MSFHFPGETQKLNEETRSTADGSFVPLQDGVTHYELTGPEAAQAVVLVHGFSVPYFIFDPTFEFLAASGFRVLRYDLFGRGWSDRPRLRSDVGLFVRQLNDLLDALGIRSPVSLVGLSMGGPISASFTVRHPERVARNVFIDPSGTHALRLGALSLGLLPLVGEAAGALLGTEYLLDNIA